MIDQRFVLGNVLLLKQATRQLDRGAQLIELDQPLQLRNPGVGRSLARSDSWTVGQKEVERFARSGRDELKRRHRRPRTASLDQVDRGAGQLARGDRGEAQTGFKSG